MVSGEQQPLSPAELEGRWNSFFEETDLRRRIVQIAESFPKERSLGVSFHDIDERDSALADNLLHSPEVTLKAGEKALVELLPEHLVPPTPIHLRVTGLPLSSRIVVHDLRQSHLNQFVAIEGIIRRMTEVRPQIVDAVFECAACKDRVGVEQEEGALSVKDPVKCDSCGKPLGKTRFTLVPEASRYIDSQKIEIQENPEKLKGGTHPEGLAVILLEDLTGGLVPGHRMIINGRLKSTARQGGMKGAGRPAVFDLTLLANSIEKEDREYAEIEITPEDQQAIESMRGDKDLFSRFVDSLAPSIQGMRIEKEAIALQLFGGVPKEQPDGIRIRGDIHALLVGDPGTAKSQLLRYVADIAPRGMYTSGKGSTAAGLTAAAVKDDFSGGRWTLEAGAMVLSDMGMLCVDELDKMSTNDRSSLHEGLEQQSYHALSEIMLMNGEKRPMGELVDRLFSRYPERAIVGKDCEILSLEGIERLPVLTTDFKGFHASLVDRVSRHTAPARFIRLTYGNGRILTVTPEHPIFVWRDGEFRTAPAASALPGELTPGVKEYPRSLNEAVLRMPHPSIGILQLRYPAAIEEGVARLLGYLVSGGQIRPSSTNGMPEVMVTHTDPEVVTDVQGLFTDVFGPGASPQVQSTEPPKRAEAALFQVRVLDRGIYEYFNTNFPELVRPASVKRIPNPVFHATESSRIQFIRGAYRGDGFHDSEGFGLATSSPGLARDYSDLLLSLGVYSCITRAESTDGIPGRSGTVHQVVISGSKDERRFLELVGQHDERKERILDGMERRDWEPRDEDRLPAQFVSRLKNLLLLFEMENDCFSSATETEGTCHRSTFQRYLARVTDRVQTLPPLPAVEMSPRELRKAYHIPTASVAKRVGRSSAWVCQHDKRELTAQGQLIRQAIVELSSLKLAAVQEELRSLNGWLESPIRFVPLRQVETVPNSGEKWVYDVTVEPTHTFISEGLVLHNTVSVAKAGITATLKARCPVLAAANPKLGRFSGDKTPAEEIDLPPTLLSRFDIIFALEDKPDAERDRSRAGAILDMHVEAEEREAARGTHTEKMGKAKKITDRFDPSFMRKYVAYAKQHVFPVMEPEANKMLLDFFVNLRKQGEGEHKPVPITLRQVEGLVRLTEASARARLSPVATVEDAERAIMIMEHFLKTVVQSGSGLDIDYITVGTPSSYRDKIGIIRDIMRRLQEGTPEGFTAEEVVEKARDKNIPKNEAQRLIHEIERLNEVYSPKTGKLKLME